MRPAERASSGRPANTYTHSASMSRSTTNPPDHPFCPTTRINHDQRISSSSKLLSTSRDIASRSISQNKNPYRGGDPFTKETKPKSNVTPTSHFEKHLSSTKQNTLDNKFNSTLFQQDQRYTHHVNVESTIKNKALNSMSKLAEDLAPNNLPSINKHLSTSRILRPQIRSRPAPSTLPSRDVTGKDKKNVCPSEATPYREHPQLVSTHAQAMRPSSSIKKDTEIISVPIDVDEIEESKSTNPRATTKPSKENFLFIAKEPTQRQSHKDTVLITPSNSRNEMTLSNSVAPENQIVEQRKEFGNRHNQENPQSPEIPRKKDINSDSVPQRNHFSLQQVQNNFLNLGDPRKTELLYLNSSRRYGLRSKRPDEPIDLRTPENHKKPNTTWVVNIDEHDSTGKSSKRMDKSIDESLETPTPGIELRSKRIDTDVKRNDRKAIIDLVQPSPLPLPSPEPKKVYARFRSGTNHKQNSNEAVDSDRNIDSNGTRNNSEPESARTMKAGRADRVRLPETQQSSKRQTLRAQVTEEIQNAPRQKRRRTTLAQEIRFKTRIGNDKKKSNSPKDWDRIKFDENYFSKILTEFQTSHPTLVTLPFFGMANNELRKLFELLLESGDGLGVKKLDLNNNRIHNLTRDVCEKVGLLKVSSWNMSCNRVGNIPDGIRLCNELRILDISRNQISTLSKEIGELSNLEVLNLAHNELQELPSEMRRLRNLEILNLSHNEITKLPDDIANEGSKLTSLDLSFNEVFKEFPKCAENWKKVVDLILFGTECYDTLTRKELRMSDQKLLQTLVERAAAAEENADEADDVQYVK